MKSKCGWFVFLVIILNFHGLNAQQIQSQFYSQFSLPFGLSVNTLIQANDYAIWMAGENYYDGKAFIFRCDDAGLLKWSIEFDGISDQDEISSLAPASGGSCIFTFIHTDNTGKIGYGKIDSNGVVVWFRSYIGNNLSWTSNLEVVPFGSNFVLAGSRLTNFGYGGTMNLLRIDEEGNVLASGAYNCAPHKVKKVFIDNQGNILICGDYYSQFTGGAFLAITDSNFQALSFHSYHGAVEQVHDVVINSSDEVVFSGLKWEDQIGSVWSASLMKVNGSNGQVIWGRRFVSSDWLVSEFFGIERGTDSASYFVIFEPEYFHGNTSPFQTTGILRFTENGIADTVFYRDDSTYFYTMLGQGKDKSYLQGFTNPNTSSGVIWKSNELISSLHTNGKDCFNKLTYDYPLSNVTVNPAAITCSIDSLLTFLPDILQEQFTSPSQEISCNYYWTTGDTIIGVDEPNSNAGLCVIPNPCSNGVHLSSKIEMREITLADITGKNVLSEIINSQSRDIVVSQLPRGIYIAHLKFIDDRISVFKIQVERIAQR